MVEIYCRWKWTVLVLYGWPLSTWADDGWQAVANPKEQQKQRICLFPKRGEDIGSIIRTPHPVIVGNEYYFIRISDPLLQIYSQYSQLVTRNRFLRIVGGVMWGWSFTGFIPEFFIWTISMPNFSYHQKLPNFRTPNPQPTFPTSKPTHHQGFCCFGGFAPTVFEAAFAHYSWAPGWLLSLAGLTTTLTILISLLFQRMLWRRMGLGNHSVKIR